MDIKNVFRRIISFESHPAPMELYIPLGKKNINGIQVPEYDIKTIHGAFLTDGKKIKKDEFNLTEESLKLVVDNRTEIAKDCYIKFEENIYKIKKLDNWELKGFVLATCVLAGVDEVKYLE